jgi:galactokinase
VGFASGYAPGRVELLGNHTDYNRGLVLAAAIDRGIAITGAPRRDGVITLTSKFLHSLVEIPPGERRPLPNGSWANYPLGVAQQFELAGHRIGGFDATITSDIPAGAGLSSSAAFEVAIAQFLTVLHEIRLEPMVAARLCQRAENEFVGVRSGLLDQATSMFGRAGHVVHFDFQTDEITTIPFPRDLSLVIANTATQHELLESPYNTRRQECVAAAKVLGVRSLREVSSAQLEARRDSVEPVLYRRASHIVGENERVAQAAAALRLDDAVLLGELMNASHESSRTNFENSTPELDRLVACARGLPGVLGARLTGGGFGGSIVALVRATSASEIARELARHSPLAFICQTADGAAIDWPK